MTTHISPYFYLTTTQLLLIFANNPGERGKTLCGIFVNTSASGVGMSYWRDVQKRKGGLVTAVDNWTTGCPTCDVCLILYMEAKQKALEYLRTREKALKYLREKHD